MVNFLLVVESATHSGSGLVSNPIHDSGEAISIRAKRARTVACCRKSNSRQYLWAAIAQTNHRAFMAITMAPRGTNKKMRFSQATGSSLVDVWLCGKS